MNRKRQLASIAVDRSQRGFSLVMTLIVLGLLSLVVVAILTLSTITGRQASHEKGPAGAQANARLALMLAIGELQKSLGPDQRVSANSGILVDPENSDDSDLPLQWLGVWDSWKASEQPGSEESAEDYSRHATIEGSERGAMSPTYESGRADHFRQWLVSLPPGESTEITAALAERAPGETLPGNDAEAVQLVGAGSLGEEPSENDLVSAHLRDVETGRYAWWVGDESQKARLLGDSYEKEESKLTLAEKVFRHQAPDSTGSRTVPGLEGIAAEEASIQAEEDLARLPTLNSLDLVEGAVDEPSKLFHALTPYSYAPITDVREGGLKRDLTTLLERPIPRNRRGVPTETGDEFMLYKFRTKDLWLDGNENQEAVPLHDLAAYYQLYDSGRDDWKEGVQYSSNTLDRGIQVVSPDFGGKNKEGERVYKSEHTTLYRQPVPIKIQFLLSMFAEPINPNAENVRPGDTHLLNIGITPAVTLWNPNNVPMTMRLGEPERFSQTLRMMNLPIHIEWIKNGGEFTSDKVHLSWLTNGNQYYFNDIFNLYFSGVRPIQFEPGEVKTFSLPYSGGDLHLIRQNQDPGSRWGGGWGLLFRTDTYYEPLEIVQGWEPQSFMLTERSAFKTGDNGNHTIGGKMTFAPGDRISFRVTADNPHLESGNWMMFYMSQSNHQDAEGGDTWGRRNYQITGRTSDMTRDAQGLPVQVSNYDHVSFNESIMNKGFPGGGSLISDAPRSASGIIARGRSGEGWPFLQFSFMAGTETSEASNGGAAGGRKFASRPFLHSTPIRASQLSEDDPKDFYNYGWNWWVEPVNSVFEAPVQVTRDGQGYYGGGYTPESGTTHVVQQEIPVVPPMSIASLSHAHLGGFSIANDEVGHGGLFKTYGGFADGDDPQKVTATGQAGLFPHAVQAIGNSYAHPNIPASEAYVEWSRTTSDEEGEREVILADHSYLANKALWDDYFFSSLNPRDPRVEIFEDIERSVGEVAEGFFFGEESLPNRRIVPYTRNLSEETLADLVSDSNEFTGGLADRIAAHLMVEGPFNVNSTSVEAWKVFLSSLKGKKVAYLDREAALAGEVRFAESSTEGVPVGGVSLPNGEPYQGSSTDPTEPEPWYSWRELTDTEITELAEAIVKQVRLRGPFLSLSEFVNRRLDARNPELSVKGALQAALDDEDVSINEGFRDSDRQFSDDENSNVDAVFREALEGPVAYGSAPYIDQADVLRHFATQLTPRGDTFVIRAYGDSTNRQGEVRSRAWCEAVVQRVPEYLDSTDEPDVKAADLESAVNRTFGRQLKVVSFRWLSQNEI
ncbi:MAG: hypothetical protein AAGA96_03120 [Verrucomicrobiota bacterium]